MPVVRVLQHIGPEGPGFIADALMRADIDLAVTRPDLGEPVPTRLDGESGLLVMGGPMGVYEVDEYPYLADEQRLIEHALREQKPVLGVCLGSQLLAATLGARVAPGPRKEIGWFEVTAADVAAKDPLLGRAPSKFVALHWHGDVFDLPSGAVSLARSALTVHQAFRYGGHAHGLLFHLEAKPDQVEKMAAQFADELAAEGVDAAALLAQTPACTQAAEEVARAVFGAWAASLSG